MKMRMFHFVVTGRGQFPLDMLRYECCWPTSPQDVENIDSWARDQRSVNLSVRTDNRHWMPTIDRWKSFGWNIDFAEEVR